MKSASWFVRSVACGVLSSAAVFAQGTLTSHPSFFRTLVNPECSHCIDEAKRRALELRDNERVLAWIRGKYDGGAVPLRFFLVPYRVISDTYGVWVYDADAGFLRGYEPSLEFSFYGWRNGVMVIQHKDGTLYSALSGVAFAGPRRGDVLKPLPTIETDWGYWLKAYPKTVAYHMFDKYVPQELPATVNAESVATRLPPDKRLTPDTPVLGIAAGNLARAYPISRVADQQVIRDRLGDQELVVLWYAPTRTAAIYAPWIEGGPQREPLTLQFNPQIPTAPFMDKETFSHWTIEGRAVSGPLQGKTLRWLPGVSCKWFAWAAEYPATEIDSGSHKHAAEAQAPLQARLIQGERLDWDKLVKTTGYITGLADAQDTVSVHLDSDGKEHELRVTPQSEFYVEGGWGRLTDFRPGQNVYVITMTDPSGKPAAVHALADDVSMQVLSGACRVLRNDRQGHRLVLVDAKGLKPPMELEVDRRTTFMTARGEAIEPGSLIYCSTRHTGSGRVATKVLEAESLKACQQQQKQAQRADLGRHGLTATLVDVGPTRGRVQLMVRRADAWYGRTLHIGDRVALRLHGAGSQIAAQVTAVGPEYSRVRVDLDCGGSLVPNLEPGSVVGLLIKLPDGVACDLPPDLGRFKERQARIDYMLSTIYCPCGMMGSACAGHWNTLAACKIHGCGLPDRVTRLVGRWIDEGKSDQSILAGLVREFGAEVLRIHLD